MAGLEDCEEMVKSEVIRQAGKYRQIDDIIIEFHNEFYVFEDRVVKLYQILSALSFLLLTITAFILGFLLIFFMSYEFTHSLGFYIIEYNSLITILKISLVLLFVIFFLALIFSIKRDKVMQRYYYFSFKKRKTEKDCCFTVRDVDRFFKLSLGGFIKLWVNSVLGDENIDYNIKVLDSYIKNKDGFIQALTWKSFLSNHFIRGFISTFFVGLLGFISAYYANVLSKNSEINLIGKNFYANLSFLVFYTSVFLILVYFAIIFLKEVAFECFDLFISNSKVTKFRKNRLAYQLHQSRVFKVKNIEENLYNIKRKNDL